MRCNCCVCICTCIEFMCTQISCNNDDLVKQLKMMNHLLNHGSKHLMTKNDEKKFHVDCVFMFFDNLTVF